MGVTSVILIYIMLIIIFFNFQLMISDFVHTWKVSGMYDVMQPVHAAPMLMGGELSLKYETAMNEKRKIRIIKKPGAIPGLIIYLQT